MLTFPLGTNFFNMKYSSRCLFLILLLSWACSNTNDSVSEESQPKGVNNIAYKWGKISLQCTANDTENFRPRPTVTSRILALVWVSVFDAWSRYDNTATPLYLTAVERRPS